MKKVTYIAGKWYKDCRWLNTGKDFCKASADNGGFGYINFTERIYNGVYTVIIGDWGADSTSTIEATPEEYSQFLPDGHPDKIVNSTVTEWSSGTFAVAIKGNYGVYEDGDGNRLPTNKVFCITRVDETNNNRVICHDSFFWIYKENLKWFPTKEAAEKFIADNTQEKIVSKLTEFPSEGYCQSTDVQLQNYLSLSLKLKLINGKIDTCIGVGWNKTSYWFIASGSSKKEYKISDLKPFFDSPVKQSNEWATGTYLVIVKEGYLGVNYCLTDLPKTTIGTVHQIKSICRHGVSFIGVNDINFIFEKDLAKWFETREEAEAFANTLTKKDMPTKFNAGDYIVTLSLKSGMHPTSCAKENFCFKQRETASSIKPMVDLDGDQYNSSDGLNFDKSDELLDWRYATKQEAKVYQIFKKPYDVRTIPKIGEYVTIISNTNRFIIIGKCESLHDWDIFTGPHVHNFSNSDKFKFEKNSFCFADIHRTWRASTQDEIDWLDACINQDRVVERFDPKECAGRIVKARVDAPFSIGNLKTGGYGKSLGNDRMLVGDVEFGLPNNPKYCYTLFELMPKDFRLDETPKIDISTLAETEYVVLDRDNYGFKRGDIAKVIKKDACGIYVFVPNRTSTSGYAPNVYYSEGGFNPSTKEAYDKQHTIKILPNTSFIDISGSMLPVYPTRNMEFKVGDWVVFEIARGIGKTEAWDRDMVLQIDGTSKMDSDDFLTFSAKQLNKRYPHYTWSGGSNLSNAFRHAKFWEIPIEGNGCEPTNTITTNYALCDGTETPKSVKQLPIFIHKAPATIPAPVNQPITLIKRKKLSISLLV